MTWKARRHGRRQDRRWAKAWSPEQISRRLRLKFPGDPTRRISHEAIYQALFIQGRGALRRELIACLRTGRTLRVPVARTRKRGKSFITPEIMISQRPAEVADRAVPGHASGPRLHNGPAFAGHGAEAVRGAIARTISTLPAQLRRSLTWDQGSEMAQNANVRIDTGLSVYFCDPRSPWQRGTNENTNGLLRQNFPKGTDLTVHDADPFAAVAVALNTRPRKTLSWKTPAEALDELLQSIDKGGREEAVATGA